VVAALGLVPGLVYLCVYLFHTYWLIGMDWPSRFGFAASSYIAYRGDFDIFWAAGTALRQ
jgi:hypothetical protein